VANKNLSAGTMVGDDDFGIVEIPRSAYISHQHVRAENRNLVTGQTLQRGIARGGFVLLDDVIASAGGLADEVTKGEWGVPVHFADSTLVSSFQVGDEIAIIMVVQDYVKSNRHDAEGNDELVRIQTARVLFPMVRVLRSTSDGILVSLKPQEAQRLLMAQLNAPLYPMLRRRGDSTHRSVQTGRGVTIQALKEEALVERDSFNSNQ
jgi:Flp pilus assembly protein CpaB